MRLIKGGVGAGGFGAGHQLSCVCLINQNAVRLGFQFPIFELTMCPKLFSNVPSDALSTKNQISIAVGGFPREYLYLLAGKTVHVLIGMVGKQEELVATSSGKSKSQSAAYTERHRDNGKSEDDWRRDGMRATHFEGRGMRSLFDSRA